MIVRLPRKIYVFIGAVIVAAIVGSYFALMRDVDRHKALRMEAEARILKTEVRRTNDPETAKELSVDTIVTFEYEIDINVTKSRYE
ncbi:MAG: hypothetical protein ACRD6X_16505 [Pyrinomonadaceae bacterium]